MKFLYSDLPEVRIAGKKLVGRVVFGLLLLASMVAGGLSGLLIVYSTDLPQIDELERYRPSTATELYDDQGRVIGSFALQRRVLATYEDFPQVLRDAILSTEDKSFERHWGINLWRVIGATYRDMSSGSRSQGASTLTMQLSRNLFLSPERHFSRKIQEMMLAVQIERHFTKQQIFTMYCNQIFLGHGVYGFEAGAQYYFNKHARDLKMEEAAMLAGIPKAPSSYSPMNNPERALKRRNLVINNLLEDGKITAEEARRAKSTPLGLDLQPSELSPAPYFVEEVRRYLEKKYGSSEVHESGLRVYTSLDLDLQKAANQAVLDGLAAYERRHGWKMQGRLKNIIEDGGAPDKYAHLDWSQPITPGRYLHALVLEVAPQVATVKLGGYLAPLAAPELAWTHHRFPKDLMAVGDIVYVKVLSLGPGNSARVTLEQDSGAQSALLAIENSTGEIKAMVGGRDFTESKFNRANQAMRQVGSAMKPFVYTAAIDGGADPDDLIVDAPTTFNSSGVAYTPHNYDHKFAGSITLRHAFAQSRNIPAVKLAQKVGISTVITYLRRFGISSPVPAVLPVALGAADLTLYEQTSAYTVFPNDGVRVEPHYIRRVTDYEGHILDEAFPEAKDVTGQRTARTMVSLMQGVVQFGTASAALKLRHPVAGKTGTTNEFTDAWFMGFSPGITCGVWVGFDEKKGLGEKETGSEAALPIWIDFMRVAIAQPARRDEAFLPPLPDKNKVHLAAREWRRHLPAGVR
ncbi:MAG TPA: PBP1A family penicillin-binding protein [Candidatus Saccharimonadales bacterium]|jgi:penicillin-binding protein 1A|nr:PBP1A family penicillin-binding protein [Candidatus Saccharimonadales bacterium]